MYNAREDCLVVEDYEKSAMDGDDSAGMIIDEESEQCSRILNKR